jgi:uncharacterized protein YndB with AHSA1/START domain
MSTTETTSLQKELHIEASPETVWEFLVDPAKAARWMGLAVVLEPHPGGTYRCEIVPGHTARGEVLEVDPPRRLVYTWGWEEGDEGSLVVPPGSSTIEITLEPDGSGTHLQFTHRDLPGTASVERHGRGWDHYLARLTTAAGGGDPGPDPWASGAAS